MEFSAAGADFLTRHQLLEFLCSPQDGKRDEPKLADNLRNMYLHQGYLTPPGIDESWVIDWMKWGMQKKKEQHIRYFIMQLSKGLDTYHIADQQVRCWCSLYNWARYYVFILYPEWLEKEPRSFNKSDNCIVSNSISLSTRIIESEVANSSFEIFFFKAVSSNQNQTILILKCSFCRCKVQENAWFPMPTP